MKSSKGDVFSYNYNTQFGTLAVTRGKEDGLSLFAWEPIPDCTDKDCPLSKRCHYTKREGQCQVIAQIVRAAATNILINYGPKLDNATRNRIGKHLMPLYIMLARLFVYEAALSSVHFIDNKNNPKIDPVYKEIRETVRLIELEWRYLGLPDLPIGDKEFGNYYDELEREAQAELIRNKKKKKLIRRVK